MKLPRFVCAFAIVTVLYGLSLPLRAYWRISEAKTYSRSALLEVARPWSIAALQPHLSKVATAETGSYQRFVEQAAEQVGGLVEISDVKCMLASEKAWAGRGDFGAFCALKSRFARGTAVVGFKLHLDAGDQWRIEALQIEGQ